jgi:hypothetical protein
LKQCEQLVALDQKLGAVLDGKEKPADDAERVNLAWLCQQPYKRRYAAAARFYAEAFDAKPELTKNPASGVRYDAACVAALAGCGKGEDAGQLDDKERTRLRNQAVEWLRADLAHWTRQAASDKADDRTRVLQTLKHWQEDADLAGIRDKTALEKLPAEEREACQKLWADVEALLQKVQEKPQ